MSSGSSRVVVGLDFDRSATVVTGCAQQVDELPLADCWIGSVDE